MGLLFADTAEDAIDIWWARSILFADGSALVTHEGLVEPIIAVEDSTTV